MYIVRDNKTEEYSIFKEKVQVSRHTGATTQTIRNHKHDLKWNYKHFTIIKPDKVEIKSNRGRVFGISSRKRQSSIDNLRQFQ